MTVRTLRQVIDRGEQSLTNLQQRLAKAESELDLAREQSKKDQAASQAQQQSET